MITREENDLLCLVEGETPMGCIMRQHWIPACLSEEVSERDGKPVRVRLLGEDLVVFRDTEGRLGAIDEFCRHRGASLAFGRNEDCGLRCLYHGWKFDVNGNVMDMPSEPGAGEALRAEAKLKSYPTVDSGGFVWLWMGDAENMAEFEPPVWASVPGEKISVVKIHTACNWAQVLEGSIDSAHSSSLHSSNMPPAEVDGAKATATSWPRPSNDKAPRIRFDRTDYGFRYAAVRTPIIDPDKNDYIRNTWCFDGAGRLDRDRATALTAGYESVRPLEDAEKAALPVLARGAAMRFLTTRLHDWFHTPADALTRRKDPLELVPVIEFHRAVSDSDAYGVS